VVGGLKTIGEATLECQAGPGPITVKLDSSKPALAYPVAASISVPQAAKSASFEVATNVVLSTQSAKITATANGIAQSKWLYVDRAPAVEPIQISFGSVPVGTTAPTRSVTLSNNGGPLSISSIGITGPYASWFAQTNNCGAILNAWASCTIRVTFKPLASGGGWASLSIATSATPLSVGLTGTGTTAN
jgi:hypothetical protein